jgi:Flp pilus assembly protein TadB
MENWEHRWRRKTTYDAQGRLIGTVIEEESTYTPPHLLQLQPSERQRGGKGLLWLLFLFLLAPLAFPLIIFGLMVLGMLFALLQKVLLTLLLVVAGLLVLVLLFRLAGRIPRKP